jgi:hypothetical protein
MYAHAKNSVLSQKDVLIVKHLFLRIGRYVQNALVDKIRQQYPY